MELADLKQTLRHLVLGFVILLLLITTASMCKRTVFDPAEGDLFTLRIQDMLGEMDTVLRQIKEQSLSIPPLQGLDQLRVKKTEPAPPVEEEAAEEIVQAAAKEVELIVTAIAGDRSDQVALVNNSLVGLNEIVEGLKVISITQNLVVFEDEEGNRREVNVYSRLEKYEE